MRTCAKCWQYLLPSETKKTEKGIKLCDRCFDKEQTKLK